MAKVDSLDKDQIDPVCGMRVAVTSPIWFDHAGSRYYFCCKSCRERFSANPQSYLNKPTSMASDAVMVMPSFKGAKISVPVIGSPMPAPSMPSSSMSGSCCSGEEASTIASEHACCHGGHEKVIPSATAAYFCPMCPGQESSVPGTCAICGMALERNPLAVNLETRYRCPIHKRRLQREPGRCPDCDRELVATQIVVDADEERQWRALWLRSVAAGLLGGIVFLIAMLPMVGVPIDRWLGEKVSQWTQAILSGIVVFGLAWPFWQSGWAGIRRGSPNMFSLIGVGTLAAFFYSLVVLLWPSIVPHALGHDHHLPIYFESAAVIVALVYLGQVLEVQARRRTGDALLALMELTPTIAHRLDGANTVDVDANQLHVGDLVLVRPGERIPVDGVVQEGQATVDQSSLTGEPIPVSAIAGTKLFGGSMLVSGSLTLKVTCEPTATVLQQVIRLVSQSQRSRAPIQDRVDAVAKWFVPCVLVAAIAAGFAWWMWGPEPRISYSLLAVVSVLIIACPCALGLAVPMSLMVGIGRAAASGVLVRDAASLEVMSRVRSIVLDKTGTLTEGKPRVIAFHHVRDLDRPTVLNAIGQLEQRSEHPFARAIVDYIRANVILRDVVVDQFESVAGEGIVGRVQGEHGAWSTVAIGRPEWIRSKLVASSSEASSSDAQNSIGSSFVGKSSDFGQSRASAIHVAVDGRLVGMLYLADELKPRAKHAIDYLHGRGLEVHLVSGDDERVVVSIASELGIQHFRGRTSPVDKHAYIQSLQQRGTLVAMAGDGVNDAAALAAADVGIAMATGTDVAMEAAGLTLLRGDVSGIARAFLIGDALQQNIRQNLWLGFLYNVVSIPIAAGVLYPLFGIMLSPMIAAAAMAASSVSVIGNALRLKARQFKLPYE